MKIMMIQMNMKFDTTGLELYLRYTDILYWDQ